MNVYNKWIKVKTKRPYDFVDITEKVIEIVKESKIKRGMVFINSIHNTAIALIQENDKTIFEDMKELLDRILPLNKKYHHDYEGNLNATAHLKTNLVGQTISLPVIDSRPVLGSWQRIIFVEWLEPRERKILVTVMGD